MFTCKVECNNKTYESQGETILDALNAIPLSFVEVKTKGTITITDGTKTASKFFPLAKLRPLVGSKFVKIIESKFFNTLLK